MTAPSQLRQTHTVVTLGISQPAFDEIAAKLRAAGYDHVFMPDGEIDMSGIAVALDPDGEPRVTALDVRPLPKLDPGQDVKVRLPAGDVTVKAVTGPDGKVGIRVGHLQAGATMQPCTHCGWQPLGDLAEIVYPTGLHAIWLDQGTPAQAMHLQKVPGHESMAHWEGHCLESRGGCGAKVWGLGRNGAIGAWDRRPTGRENVLVAMEMSPAEAEQERQFISDTMAGLHHAAGAPADDGCADPSCTACRPAGVGEVPRG